MRLIDTSSLIEMLRNGRYELGSISAITLLEVLRGVGREKRKDVKKLLEESFDVIWLDNDIIEIYCDLYDRLRERGLEIPDADLLIASTALSKNLVLRTKDKHFERLRDLGLSVEGL